jgi:hypothetical protein
MPTSASHSAAAGRQSSLVDDDDDSALDPSEQTQRPVDNALNQQRLDAWHPILDPLFVIVALFYLGVIMVPVGEYRVQTCVGLGKSQILWYLLVHK